LPSIASMLLMLGGELGRQDSALGV